MIGRKQKPLRGPYTRRTTSFTKSTSFHSYSRVFSELFDCVRSIGRMDGNESGSEGSVEEDEELGGNFSV